MQVTIQQINDKKLIGIRATMSLKDYRVADLWRTFHVRRPQISNIVSPELFSLTIYNSQYFARFNPAIEFEKWAAVEVSDFSRVTDGWETCVLPGGLYAVFEYKGLSSNNSIFEYIYTSWLPQSGYILDDRPHVEVLGARYKNDDPESEELIWIPIRSV
nr:GyrI-like domain-containing protein [uncultured Dyadobacter sp.]